MHPFKRGILAVALIAAAFVTVMAPLAASAQTPPPPTPPNGSAPPPDAEEVTSFASEVTVRTDGVVEVVERIEYFFPELRHGIFRDIPRKYDLDGRTVEIPIENVQVSGAPYVLEGDRDSLRIRIGDPGTEVKGMKSYVISYELHGAISYDDADVDKLIYDVTGNDWQVPIRRTSAIVHLPDGVDAAHVTSRCFTGPYGSTAQDCLHNRQANDVYFVAAGPLTVEAGWGPKGLVAVLRPEVPWYEDPRLPGLPYVALLLPPFLAFALMFRRWRAKGRDRARLGAVPPQYDAPEGMRPALMGLIADERVDHRDLAATVIDLAVRGHLKMEETKGTFFGGADFELVRLENAEDELGPFEEKLVAAVFGGAPSVKMSEIRGSDAVYRGMDAAQKELYRLATERGYFVDDPRRTRMRYVGVGTALAVLGIAGVVIGASTVKILMLFGAGILVSGVIVLGFAPAMPAKTVAGVEAYRHILGFKEYLSRAEKYRLQWQEKENVLEAFLPYAMAFGVVEKWTKAMGRFGKEMRQPAWYGNATGAAFDVSAFGRSMAKFGSGIATASTKQNAAYASSGGGFSGGGVGGGGGGSW